jgi:PucR family transcriptional regulator, purine catabolism regulatory protein
VCAVVESGGGLIELVRAAAGALGASIVLLDRTSSVLAVAARSPAEESSLLDRGAGVQDVELRVADHAVGHLRLRPREQPPAPSLLRAVAALVALEAERMRGPDRASQEATGAFVRSLLARELTGREELVAAGREVGIDLSKGGVVVVLRAHHVAPGEDRWRERLIAVAQRAARATVPGTIAVLGPGDERPVAEVVALVPDPDEEAARRVAEAVVHELEAGLSGLRISAGVSRRTPDPVDLHRAGNEALLAANVAEGDTGRPVLAFEQTGAYRLLLSAMSEDPDELRQFFADTLQPVIAYDEQYETDLVQTLATYLEADGNVAGTAQRLFTHRHTVRYRLERVRELSGHDVTSSDGREKLSLGLKAMRVLGVPPPRGPATERGAEAGRVPRESKDRG